MTDAEERFIEVMGTIHQRGGSPRISGRIFGLMIVRGNAISLQDIADTLQVSKASVSTNARLLRDRGMVRLTSQPGERQDYYELVPNPFQGMLEILSKEMSQAADEVSQAMTHFGDDQTDVLGRIDNLQNFYKGSASFLGDISEKLSHSK